MVSFICDACQETVKKNKVESHCYKCRDCWELSCVDCGSRFQGNEYAKHLSCISEAEKYQGSLYQKKSEKELSKDPQARWMQCIHEVCANRTNVSSMANRILDQMAGYDNVPRKQAKFKNFLTNSFRIQSNNPVVDEIWKLFTQQWDAVKLPPNNNNAKPVTKQPEAPSVPEEETKSDKVPKSENDDTKWQKKIKPILKNADAQELKLKTLRKMLQEKNLAVKKSKLKEYIKNTPSRYRLHDKVVKLVTKS